MIIRIIRHEWGDLFADHGTWIALILFALFVGYSLYSGAVWEDKLNVASLKPVREAESEIARLRAQLANGSNEQDVATGGTNAADPLNLRDREIRLPLTPLAMLSTGQADLLPINRTISLVSQSRTASDKYGFDNPLTLLVGRFDLAFVTIYLFPLLILALSYDLISSEHERGTLALLLSQPIHPRTLLVAKAGARAAVVLALVIGLSLGAALVSRASLRESASMTGLLFWGLAAAAYGAFWFSLALAVSRRGQSSAANGVTLIGLWILIVLVLPALLNIVITAVYPVPSRAEEIIAERSVGLDMRRDGRRVLSEFYADHPELRPKEAGPDVDSIDLAFVNIQQEIKSRAEEVEARFNAQLDVQQSMVRRFRFVSPAIVAQEAFNDIAGTGPARFQRFRDLAGAYDRQWNEFLVPKVYKSQKLTAPDYDNLPNFVFVDEAFTTFAGRMAVSLFGLIVPTLGLTFLGLRAANRYPIGF